MHCDVLIFGGGVAGLWLLDELQRRGVRVLLLEAEALGSGQTVASQGIIHGGLKYTLQGLMTDSARQIREMPELWRGCLAGERCPDLSDTPLRSPCCYLWRTDSLSSRLGMIGARIGLRVAPSTLSAEERPAVLARCPGVVARLEEPVISPAGLLANFAQRHAGRLLKIDARRGTRFECTGPGTVAVVHLTSPVGQSLELRPRYVVFAAGAGNARLRGEAGLPGEVMQKRPLHMVLVRGPLPQFHGHCVDGAKTRVTITSDRDAQGRTVWQLGGQIAELGVQYERPALIAHAQRELQAVLPGIDLANTDWATYRVDRAERVTPSGTRPETAQVLIEGNCLTAWPTKLALAPQLAEQVIEKLDVPHARADESSPCELADWPKPAVAPSPWETISDWHAWKDESARRAA